MAAAAAAAYLFHPKGSGAVEETKFYNMKFPSFPTDNANTSQAISASPIFIQPSVSTICINEKYLYNFCVSAVIFGHHQVTLYIHSTYFAISSLPLANVYIWGRSCVSYIVQNDSFSDLKYIYM
jgi:hypothetical protein